MAGHPKDDGLPQAAEAETEELKAPSGTQERYKLDLVTLEKNKPKFLAMSSMGEKEICELWLVQGGGEEAAYRNIDLKTIVKYNPLAPLWEKMLWRFRNCSGCTSVMWNQIDPGNQMRLLREHGLGNYNYSNQKIPNCMHFFAWLKNGLGLADLSMLLGSSDKTLVMTKETKRWAQSNAIQYYYNSPEKLQNLLRDAYNNFLSLY